MLLHTNVSCLVEDNDYCGLAVYNGLEHPVVKKVWNLRLSLLSYSFGLFRFITTSDQTDTDTELSLSRGQTINKTEFGN